MLVSGAGAVVVGVVVYVQGYLAPPRTTIGP